MCPTFRAACLELKLLEHNAHWDMAIAETIISASPSHPRDLVNKYKSKMSEDILQRIRASSRNP